MHVSDGRAQREVWGEYLRRMTSRPGWSVARLHRESGVARQTIFKWMSPRPGGVTMASVRAIGQALDDLPGALRAASGSLTDGPQPIVVDADAVPDEEIAMVLADEHLSNPVKARIINTIFERRERDRLRRIEETRQMIERAAG